MTKWSGYLYLMSSQCVNELTKWSKVVERLIKYRNEVNVEEREKKKEVTRETR